MALEASKGSLPSVFVVARMSSTRLPGKMLMKFGDQPLIAHVVGAAIAARSTAGVVVVTSDHPSDDPIDQWCRARKVAVWRGALDDVAGRMLAAAAGLGVESFVRISGDSPMIDPSIITYAAERFATTKPDLVTNVNPRSFPAGQSVEVVRVATLGSLLGVGDSRPGDREHVTPVLYRHEHAIDVERFSPGDLAPATAESDASFVSMTVDTARDAQRFRRIVAGEGNSSVWQHGWIQCQALARAADFEIQLSPGSESE